MKVTPLRTAALGLAVMVAWLLLRSRRERSLAMGVMSMSWLKEHAYNRRGDHAMSALEADIIYG